MQLTANEKSYQAIRKKLEAGKLAPGDRLVTRALAEEFGVSLSPVREALNRLATEGLVSHVPGAGAEVKRMTIDDLNELYILREAIEMCAAGLAAELATSDDREELEFLYQSQKTLASEIGNSSGKSPSRPQRSKWVTLEERFHESIIRCSRNKLLAKVIRDHRTIGRIFETHLKHDSLLTPEVALATVQCKRELLDAIGARDSGRAREIMRQQIQRGRRHVIGLLRQQELNS